MGARRWVRLLVVVVLALGVFVMHTVGHPTESEGPGASHRSAAAMASSPEAPAHDAVQLPPHAMDMASLCVAVLGFWAFAALLYAALARRAEWAGRVPVALLRVVRGRPPPRTPDLTELSVLRI
ncbi:DUF6153 family protein [Streptomyces sp. NBC_01465]|uniref:DUF6153 family protein n=1 Tax=Streptomyces sp. NBC_01465 TaxID=2903878 RepID=UPI002E339B42|nr:DUF6153 family protein [Streptomyces sp. NBC_01465]